MYTALGTAVRVQTEKKEIMQDFTRTSRVINRREETWKKRLGPQWLTEAITEQVTSF